MSEHENDGVVEGPGETAEPRVDTDRVGPDGTVYDEDALDEAERKMGIDGEAEKDESREAGGGASS